MVGAGKGDADTRSPNLEARHRAYDRIYRRLYTREDLLEFVREYYEEEYQSDENFARSVGGVLEGLMLTPSDARVLQGTAITCLLTTQAVLDIVKELGHPDILWKRQEQTKG